MGGATRSGADLPDYSEKEKGALARRPRGERRVLNGKLSPSLSAPTVDTLAKLKRSLLRTTDGAFTITVEAEPRGATKKAPPKRGLSVMKS